MRPFEVLTLVLAALSLLPFILPTRYHSRRLRWLPLTAALALVLHIILEGYRWQMLPAYLLVVVLALLTFVSVLLPQRPVRSQALRVSGGALALLWLVLSIALPYALPVPRPKAPTGPYAVGTLSAHLVDESRPESFSEQVTHRELMVQVWYPAQIDADSERAPFIDHIDVAGPAIARRLNLPPFIFGHLNLVHTAAYLDARRWRAVYSADLLSPIARIVAKNSPAMDTLSPPSITPMPTCSPPFLMDASSSTIRRPLCRPK